MTRSRWPFTFLGLHTDNYLPTYLPYTCSIPYCTWCTYCILHDKLRFGTTWGFTKRGSVTWWADRTYPILYLSTQGNSLDPMHARPRWVQVTRRLKIFSPSSGPSLMRTHLVAPHWTQATYLRLGHVHWSGNNYLFRRVPSWELSLFEMGVNVKTMNQWTLHRCTTFKVKMPWTNTPILLY